jgi:hypothetical protein
MGKQELPAEKNQPESAFSQWVPIQTDNQLTIQTLPAEFFQREMYIRLALGELLMMSSVSGQRSPRK